MSRPASDRAPLEALRLTLRRATAELAGSDAGAAARLERARRAGQGDYATNAAMLLAPVLREQPRAIAERLAEGLASELGDLLDRAEVAGPGFVNLFLSEAWYRRALESVLAAGDAFGAGGAPDPERVLVEFVSANPTGPLVAASGRHAAYGDALARVLAHHGHEVAREYYFNDAGSQIRLLGQSVQARALGSEVPEGGYQGDYVAGLAQEIDDAGSAPVETVAERAVALLLEQIKDTLGRYGVRFDRFFSERSLHPEGIQRALATLEEHGHLYRSEGAVWLRATTFGDDKDRVLVRSSGDPTYLAADLAYLLDKRGRGFERLLTPVGSDHHAYARTLKAGMAAMGGDPDIVELPIIQFMHLVSSQGVAAMSKRRGEFVTLDELLGDIGVDATRYFMLQRSHDRTLDLDLDLARQQSRENPVYYVQYAHARIESMLRRAGDERTAVALAGGEGWGGLELAAEERNLIKAVLEFPDEVAEAATGRAPHRIANYALELAREFTAFYESCRVVGASPAELESFRIALSSAARQTIALALGLLGVSAPESM